MQKKHLTKFNTHSWWITKQTRNSKGTSSTWERLHEKPTRNITLSGEHQQSKTERSPPKISDKTRMPALASQCEGQSRKEHEAKGILAAKEVKLSLMTDDTILYIKGPQEVAQKLSQVIHKSIQAAGRKISTPKRSTIFLNTLNKKIWKLRKQLHLQ